MSINDKEQVKTQAIESSIDMTVHTTVISLSLSLSLSLSEGFRQQALYYITVISKGQLA
jgi:hypothetical protein